MKKTQGMSRIVSEGLQRTLFFSIFQTFATAEGRFNPKPPFQPILYQSALTRYRTTPCDGTTALIVLPIFSLLPVHRSSSE